MTIRKSLLPGVLLTSFLRFSQGQRNLIQNPGFVDGNLDQWACLPSTTDCGVLTAAPPQPDYIGYISSGYSLTQSTFAGNNIPYLLQFATYCADQNNVSAFDCQFPLNVSLGSASYEDDVSVYITQKSKILTPSSSSSNLTFFTPSNASTAGWQLYIDNVTVYALAEGGAFQSSDNLLQNGGFEESTANTGPNSGWGCTPSVSSGCCLVATVGGPEKFAEEGMNYAELYPGCNLIQTPSTEAGKSYELTFWGYCYVNGTTSTCESNNLSVDIGNNSTSGSGTSQYTLPSGDGWIGPYSMFSHTFTAAGNDTISISTASPVRLDNFTLFLTTSSSSSGSGGSSSSNVGAIAGGVVGGVAVLGVLIAGSLWWKKRKDKAATTTSSKWMANEGLVGGNNLSGEKFPYQDAPNLSYPSYTPAPSSGEQTSSSPPPPSVVSNVQNSQQEIMRNDNGFGSQQYSDSNQGGGNRPVTYIPEIQSEGDLNTPDSYPGYPSYGRG